MDKALEVPKSVVVEDKDVISIAPPCLNVISFFKDYFFFPDRVV